MAETISDVIKIVFSAEGQNEVARAFEGLEARMGRFEKASQRTTADGVRARVAAARKEKDEREAAMAALSKETAKWEKDAVKATEKAARDKATAEKTGARDRLREEEKLARDKQRILDNSARYAGRLAEQQATAEIRAAQRAAREKTRLAERSAREARSMASRAVGSVGGAMSRVLGGVGMLAGGALAIGGGASFADSIRDELGAEKAAAILSNSAYQRGAAGPSGVRVAPAALMAKAKEIQGLTNLSKTEVLAGMQAFVAKTGHAEILGAGDKSVLESAQLAKATGSSFADVMNAQGILVAQNKEFQNDPAKAAAMLRNVVAQGKMGAVEMGDLASIAGKITASSAMYQGNQGDTQRKLLALSQVVFPVAGSADETATSITHLGADAMKHSADLKKLGLFDEKTGLIKGGPEDIITKVLGATGGNIGKIQSLGFGERSIRAFEALAPDYLKALETTHGDKNAAMSAIGTQIGAFTNASMSKQDVESDLSVVMQGRAEKIDAAMIRLEEILADKGVPLFERFMNRLDENMPAIERNIGKLTDLLAWFAANPFEGLGALVAVAVGKDILNAGIGAAAKMAITQAITGAQSAAANPRSLLPSSVGVPGGGGAISAAAGAGIVALTVAGALDTAHGIDTSTDARSRGHSAAVGTAAQLGNISRALRAGQSSPEDAKKALAGANALLAKGNATTAGDVANASLGGGGLIDSAGAAIGLGSSITGTRASQEKIGEAAGIRDGERQLVEAIKLLTKQIESGGAVAGNTANGSVADPSHPARRGPPIAQ